MCGIAAIIGWEERPGERIREMIRIIRHRGPDAIGFYFDAQVALGHARLRILDLDPKADQPLANNDQTVWVIFNGEIYNYKELRQEVPEFPFKTQCDTEAIIAAYERWNTDCVHHFNGMFAFVLYDKRRNFLFGARDRFGIKPLFYSRKRGEVLIASEIKSLLTQIGPAEPDYSAMNEFLARGNLEYRRETFFKGVFQLLPGEAFIYRDRKFTLYRYYDLRDHVEVDRNLSLGESCDRLLDIFKSSVKYRLQSDVPVGVYFSGGVDSTAIAGVLKKKLEIGGIHALTAVSKDVSKDERDYIERLARALGLDLRFCHTDHMNASGFLRRAMWHMEMPFIENNVCDDVLNSTARDQGMVVVLEGQGSDESQAGYYHHYVAFLVDLFVRGRWISFLRGLRRAQWPLRGSRLIPDWFQLLRARILPPTLSRQSHRTLPPYGSRQLAVGSWQSAVQHSPLRIPHSAMDYATEDFREFNYREDDPIGRPFSSELYNSLYRDFYTKLQRVLRFKDRMSMAYSRELRVPFLDHRLVEWMFTVPNRHKIKNGIQKNVLKQVMADLIPPEAVQTPKNILLRKSVSSDMRKALAREAVAMLTRPEAERRGLFYTEKIRGDFENGKIDGRVLWTMSQIELWHEVFIDGSINKSSSFAVHPP